MPSSAIDYATAAHTVHRMLRDRGITCDVVHPDADLSAYRTVLDEGGRTEFTARGWSRERSSSELNP